MAPRRKFLPLSEKQRWILAWSGLACSALFYLGVQLWTRPIADPEPSQVARLAVAVLTGAPARPDWLPAGRGDVHVRLRKGGQLLGQAWGTGGTWGENLQRALEASRGEGPLPDTVAVCLGTDYRPLALRGDTPQQLQPRVGLDGLELQGPSDPQLYRLAPLEMVLMGQDFKAALRPLQLDESSFIDLGATQFGTHQVLVTVDPPRGQPLQRGHAVLPEGMTAADYAEFRDLASDWLVRHVDERGWVPYSYLPVIDQSSEVGLLPVRLWLATWALARLARAGHAGAQEAYSRNLEATLGAFLRQGRLVHEDGSEHLGDYACAGMALLEGPVERPEVLRQLVALTERMQRPDGSLVTHPHRPEKGGNEQFYPGETLLLWATLYARQPAPQRLERLRKAFTFYREFYRQKPVQAFVPWHTQAWERLYAVTRDPELRDFVFEMNDWLAAQVHTGGEPDQRGAFGPQQPHCSSTAVYVEGLASAWRLAREAGDGQRAATYERAIRLGLHNLWQHQYRLPEDLYLAANPANARGALRSNVWRTPVRIDNVAHTVLAGFDLEAAGFTP